MLSLTALLVPSLTVLGPQVFLDECSIGYIPYEALRQTTICTGSAQQGYPVANYPELRQQRAAGWRTRGLVRNLYREFCSLVQYFIRLLLLRNGKHKCLKPLR